jgi:arginyl-tRNA synthetase
MGSILRTAQERGIDPSTWQGADLSLLGHPSELLLIRKMLELSEVLERVVLLLAPHHLAFYAHDLAGIFHDFYDDCRVISSDPAEAGLTAARLRLVAATKTVFARVLDLMGVTAPETM